MVSCFAKSVCVSRFVCVRVVQSSYGAESDHPHGSYSVVESFPDAYE